MKRYYSFDSAPLKFHKAFYKVISPILIVTQAILLLATIGHLINYNGYYNIAALVLNLFLYSLEIIFLSFITYGFEKKKEYAWYMVYAHLFLIVLSNVISATQSNNAAMAVGQIIGSLIVPTLIGIYYYERKPLFVPSNADNVVETAKYTLRHPNTVDKNNETTINYCRKCGNQITKDSVFCNKCGEKIDWN